ncbi:glycosyltransferase [Podospora australis]|uniref:Dol-P-Glc:Glc(2)Man(9)GlcNAc(2)-PP-Dol alpha-1,2-glucosyltransferase n=1 Tax=Podospora australis TaxID=1536484 RepID=A0AAN6WQM0_9PEZI|nr:glycosyltransferase [Podospora australis]
MTPSSNSVQEAGRHFNLEPPPYQELLDWSHIGGLFAITLVLAHNVVPFIGPRSTTHFSLFHHTLVAVILFAVLLTGYLWLLHVSWFVPRPYLDEFFHIPQAQQYCAGNLSHWDDKITTPPGLYLVSLLAKKFLKTKCESFDLRASNLLAVLLIITTATGCRHQIETIQTKTAGRRTTWGGKSWYSIHTAVNIGLMPVIFFFSGLYYTDVWSTLVVLQAYKHHLTRLAVRERPTITNDLLTIIWGITVLFMRQTNVFWVVVYMGGVEAVHSLRSVKPAHNQEFWTKIHDPPLDKSGPVDWLLFLLTTATTALLNPLTLLRQIWPHLTVLSLFGIFVAYNGGVVLGDKSNHVATIHLAQMLYIWPFFAFFSLPLALLPSILRVRSLVIGLGNISIHWSLLTTAVSLAVVKFNTIIHPFTLADNRHYIFYVFRHTILRSSAVRLVLVAPYTLARWLVWDSLVSSTPSRVEKQQKVVTPAEPEPMPLLDSPHNPGISTHSPATSTVVLWLLTTALSLITAPLVEPRYFILPWVFYRLLVPAWSPFAMTSVKGGQSTTTTNSRNWPQKLLAKFDPRLFLETAWFLAINLGTMYMFLYKPFFWPWEESKSDVENLTPQRFMW